MPRRLYTVQNLIDETRSTIDETNQDSVSDITDILPALNRGLDYAGSLLASRYPDPFLRTTQLILSPSNAEYDIPEDCFEDRVLRIDFVDTSGHVVGQCTRVSYYDFNKYKSIQSGPIPEVYSIFGRRIRFNRPPSSQYQANVEYMRQPEQLMVPQGRITAINRTSNYIILDETGSDLTSETDQLESYINVCDAQTGIVKWSGQIQIIDNNQLTFRTTPTRTSVLERTISGTMPDESDDPTIELDDIICVVNGTAVLEFSQPLSNYLIEFASAQMQRKLGANPEGISPDQAILSKFEDRITSTAGGRETTRRVQNRSIYNRVPRRRIITQR